MIRNITAKIEYLGPNRTVPVYGNLLLINKPKEIKVPFYTFMRVLADEAFNVWEDNFEAWAKSRGEIVYPSLMAGYDKVKSGESKILGDEDEQGDADIVGENADGTTDEVTDDTEEENSETSTPVGEEEKPEETVDNADVGNSDESPADGESEEAPAAEDTEETKEDTEVPATEENTESEEAPAAYTGRRGRRSNK